MPLLKESDLESLAKVINQINRMSLREVGQRGRDGWKKSSVHRCFNIQRGAQYRALSGQRVWLVWGYIRG